MPEPKSILVRNRQKALGTSPLRKAQALARLRHLVARSSKIAFTNVADAFAAGVACGLWTGEQLGTFHDGARRTTLEPRLCPEPEEPSARPSMRITRCDEFAPDPRARGSGHVGVLLQRRSRHEAKTHRIETWKERR